MHTIKLSQVDKKNFLCLNGRTCGMHGSRMKVNGNVCLIILSFFYKWLIER